MTVIHPDWISCRYVFGGIASSSILRVHQCTTPSSMSPTDVVDIKAELTRIIMVGIDCNRDCFIKVLVAADV